jgi:hypothetical protein
MSPHYIASRVREFLSDGYTVSECTDVEDSRLSDESWFEAVIDGDSYAITVERIDP